MAKKTTTKRRGGRKPGAWTQAKPEQIISYRTEHKLSRLTFAKALGVSPTTVQNWETGKGVATAKAQTKLALILSKPPAARLPDLTENGATSTHRATSNDMVIDATARIVTAFLASAKIKREELRGVVEDVRAALA